MKDRPDAFWIDRKFQRRRGFLGKRVALARGKLKQLFRIDGNRVGFDAGRRRDCRGDDLGLDLQALHPGLDQTFAELV